MAQAGEPVRVGRMACPACSRSWRISRMRRLIVSGWTLTKAATAVCGRPRRWWRTVARSGRASSQAAQSRSPWELSEGLATPIGRPAP